jgi:hypothetical protein
MGMGDSSVEALGQMSIVGAPAPIREEEEHDCSDISKGKDDTSWWLREDCRDLYLNEIIGRDGAGATRCSLRSGALRFALNAAYAVKRRYIQSQNYTKEVLFLEFGVFEGDDMTRFAAQLEQMDLSCPSSSVKQRRNRRRKKRETTSTQTNGDGGVNTEDGDVEEGAPANSRNDNPHKMSMLHGFDSFEGLPTAWDNGQYETLLQENKQEVSQTGNTSEKDAHDVFEDKNSNNALLFEKGAFDIGGIPPVIYKADGATPCDNVKLYKGWFDATVPPFFDQCCGGVSDSSNNNKPKSKACMPAIAFVHADADLYSSTMIFLEEISRRQLWVVGSVILLDEYTNYPNWQDGEYKAWDEICERYHIKYRYLCYHGPSQGSIKARMAHTRNRFGYMSVGVVITSLGSEFH